MLQLCVLQCDVCEVMTVCYDCVHYRGVHCSKGLEVPSAAYGTKYCRREGKQ